MAGISGAKGAHLPCLSNELGGNLGQDGVRNVRSPRKIPYRLGLAGWKTVLKYEFQQERRISRGAANIFAPGTPAQLIENMTTEKMAKSFFKLMLIIYNYSFEFSSY